MRAESLGLRGWHGAVNSELSDGVVGSGHHAPALGRATDDDRTADQFRPVAFLDRGVKGVHVRMKDH